MQRALFLLLVWAATTLPGFAAGLIIIHDDDFWIRDRRKKPDVAGETPITGVVL